MTKEDFKKKYVLFIPHPARAVFDADLNRLLIGCDPLPPRTMSEGLRKDFEGLVDKEHATGYKLKEQYDFYEVKCAVEEMVRNTDKPMSKRLLDGDADVTDILKKVGVIDLWFDKIEPSPRTFTQQEVLDAIEKTTYNDCYVYKHALKNLLGI